MSKPTATGAAELEFLGQLANATSRRTFLQWAGLTIGVAAVGCSDDDDDDGTGPGPNDSVNLGSGDTGVLNYAYALEQLEAAFYTQVVMTPYTGITADETSILRDIRDHEITHQKFLQAALGAGAIGALSVTFASITFSSRASVLGAAKTFEDLGVAAYNGAGQLISSDVNLGYAGKIVSVEGRHAAVIRDLLNPNSMDFAGDDVVNAQGFDRAFTPSAVLAAADPFVINPINASSLPTS